jgi:hypothetical protein
MFLMLTAGLLTGVSTLGVTGGWADESAAKPEPAEPQQAMPAEIQPESTAVTPADNTVEATEKGPSLGDLQTFDVHAFEPREFSVGREMAVPPEMGEYARMAIQTDGRLNYSSPGQGVLHFRCDSASCGRIRAEITVGRDGPVVWSTIRTFRPMLTVQDPNPRKFAREVVEQLGADYSKALKAVPLKIQIKDGE